MLVELAQHQNSFLTPMLLSVVTQRPLARHCSTMNHLKDGPPHFQSMSHPSSLSLLLSLDCWRMPVKLGKQRLGDGVLQLSISQVVVAKQSWLKDISHTTHPKPLEYISPRCSLLSLRFARFRSESIQLFPERFLLK
ncbi:unnamed protein product [Rhizoctonia solani]|uniref:Uncharacterized protein n=1 Tax=Rhizoctonia solani TaxID=456999 RepID=A0A8H3H401_9AGAM|nr:unnamed protein product [Rhizoctonia solani]